MSDLISRQAAIDALHTWFRDGFDEDKWWNSTHVLAAIEGLPSAQPEHGRWEVIGQPYMRKHFNPVCCSICKRRGYNTPYCPHCGASMSMDEVSE